MRDAGIPVVGGFQTPLEKECLRLLLRGEQPVVVCPARSIENMRIPGDWRRPLSQDRLLILSPFPPSCKRPTAKLAAQRNDLVGKARQQGVHRARRPGQQDRILRPTACNFPQAVAHIGQPRER